MRIFILFLGLIALAVGADARVLAKGPTGFAVEHQVGLAVEPKAAYDAFLKIGSWWSSAHSFSGDAKNISIDAKPGGCWCETLPDGGFVKHMELAQAAPGARLVFSGGLGPLSFMGVAGSMTVKFAATKTGATVVTLNYDVGGRDSESFEKLAGAVDGVLAEQLARYRNFATTGKP
ncbi:MAG: ATPase [Alphaproteobacteria bacterium]|nr:ATPase [Alphaproteobacteria bacterium]